MPAVGDRVESARLILDHLRKVGGWHSPTVIARALWPGTKRHSAYTSPILLGMVRHGYVERNDKGHYRAKS